MRMKINGVSVSNKMNICKISTVFYKKIQYIRTILIIHLDIITLAC